MTDCDRWLLVLLQCNMAMVAIARRRIFTVVTREKRNGESKENGKRIYNTRPENCVK